MNAFLLLPLSIFFLLLVLAIFYRGKIAGQIAGLLVSFTVLAAATFGLLASFEPVSMTTQITFLSIYGTLGAIAAVAAIRYLRALIAGCFSSR